MQTRQAPGIPFLSFPGCGGGDPVSEPLPLHNVQTCERR